MAFFVTKFKIVCYEAKLYKNLRSEAAIFFISFCFNWASVITCHLSVCMQNHPQLVGDD